jgi:thiosulfate sulfurtransferase
LLDQGGAIFIDVRDTDSFQAGHIESAILLNDQDIEAFLLSVDHATPLIVYCYHGNSSLGGAIYFLNNGFTHVWSMTGGFEDWRQRFPFVPSDFPAKPIGSTEA